ncbi:MAG: RNA polymerase sigma-70 factor [Cyclobacteriaceae bacterium]|nr:RNA polymerase sigma-70 factor [Cyclobacteriaceae bacterium]
MRNELTEEFKKLYFENYGRLCRKSFRIVCDEELAKDIVQDVFIKFWKTLQKVRQYESPEAYLSRATFNETINYIKQSQNRQRREASFAGENQPFERDSPESNLMAKDTSHLIDLAIDRMSEATRHAFVLSRYGQLTYAEIAATLHISVNTVEKHIGKALAILRKIIKV